MSSGDKVSSVSTASAAAIDKYYNDPELKKLVDRFQRFDFTYDLPYLAGYSKDGTTVYIDRHLPHEIAAEYQGRKYKFNPDTFLKTHELWEKALIDHLKMTYDAAHHIATKLEHRQVLAAGIPTHVYDGRGSELSKYIKADEHEKIERVPKDLDLTPYKDSNERLYDHLLKCMGQGKGKESKKSVDYTKNGSPTEHCGQVPKWKKGVCENYIDPNECKRVAGSVAPTGWCKLWQSEN